MLEGVFTVWPDFSKMPNSYSGGFVGKYESSSSLIIENASIRFYIQLEWQRGA